MKENCLKRLLSFALVIAMVVSLCPTIAFAGDTLPYRGESALADNEPTSHGYRAEDLLSWDPATDPDAELLRARVPLQNRIAAVAATQANPSLNPEVEYLTLAGDYGNAFFGGTSYTNEFSEYCFNFWQYIDYYGPWHGQTTATTPIELWDVDDERVNNDAWKNRSFEFGMMNLPNAAYTNAAHKNGVLSLGCIFLPRAYQSWRTLIQRDENGGFPYADKLIEITNYYGFDGWFVNLEGSDSPSGTAKQELAAFLKYLREEGKLYIQYYNAGGSIDTQMMDSGAADSFFKDYGWSTAGAKNETAKYGIGAVHGGFEAGGNRWNNNFSKMWQDGEIVCSIASLGTDFVHAGIDEDFGNGKQMRREDDDFQWMSAIRERMWFTGSSGNPTDSSTKSNAEVGVSRNSMPGIASLVTERSVISGDTFVTNFNTGHGLVYAKNGEVSNSHEWANISIQDILPTWQFWFESEGTALQAEYDYGTTYKKGLTAQWNQGTLVEGSTTYGEFDFDLVNPYEGGSSLAVYGKVDADNYMRLYKTNLDVTANTQMQVTFQKTSSDNVAMSLGLVFAEDINAEDNTYTVTNIPLENTTAVSDGWVTATADLSAYAGKQVAVIGLNFQGTADNYQMHIGNISYTSGKDLTPAAPTGLTIDKAFDTNEMVVSWDLADYDTVKQYNVYAVINGVEQYMGGIYDDIYYIKNVYDAQGEVTIKVKAVGADGTESEAAVATYDYSKAVTGLTVTPADGTLTVNFTPADAAAATDVSVYVPATGKTYTAQAAAGETSVVVAVPAGAEADGREYEMQVTPVGGSPKAYDGDLDDSYCIPYDGPMTGHQLTSPVACTDWYKLALSYTTRSGGAGSTEYTRGVRSHGELNHDWSRFQSLPSDILTLEVTLTDYDGNVSEKVTYNFDDQGEPIIPEVFDRVFHLDAGRKYFSVQYIKQILDTMAEANFNQLELYFSDNQGFRFALEDMTVTTEFGTYDLTPSLGDGYVGDNKYPDNSGKYLTQSEMDEIISYANSKGIELVPALNVPGHMGAILEEFPDLRYTGSKSSIDLTSDEAKAFAKAIVEKYAEYFASKGCKHFNFGADEFANDLGSMGFDVIYKNGIYKEHFVPFFNEVAAIIKDKGMTPRAFNDGVMYNNDTSVEMDRDVQITYWSSGWGGYSLASATTLNDAGFELINTNQGYYWVLGNADWQVSVKKAGEFDCTEFEGGDVIYKPAGAMLCVWCDNGAADGLDDGAGVAEKIADVIKAFGSTLPEVRNMEPLVDETYFPDAALRQAVISQVGPYVTDLSGFTGVLNCANTNVADLTGVREYLPGLTGLNLAGTKMTKVTSSMLPSGLKTLDLTNCKDLTFVELEGHPNLVVNFTGCTAVENLYLSGTNMTEIDISAMTRLHNFVISNSQISMITAANASAYTNAYYWNWQNAKLDLSAGTKEGKLKDGVESYFNTADLEEEINPVASRVGSGSLSYWGGNSTTINLNRVVPLSTIQVSNPYANWGYYEVLTKMTVEVSSDGTNYTVAAEVTDATADYTVELPEGVRAQYIRITNTDGIDCYASFTVYGHEVAPMGYTYNGQQPALVRDEMSDVIYERNGQQYQLLDLLNENYKTYRTVRGTLVADLEGESWVDAAYLTNATVVPKGVKVVITDENGETYVPSSVEEPDLGTLDETVNVALNASVQGQSAQYTGEEPYHLFDGIISGSSNKWCGRGATAWVGFTLPESVVVGKWFSVHAKGELESYITQDFSLQVLDPNGAISEEDFLEMSSNEKRSVMSNNSYWVDLDSVTGNTDVEVTRNIPQENLIQAQVYRLYVGKSTAGNDNNVRINELELYAYTGALKADTNGVFVADEIGTWNVSYQKAGQELANVNVRVRLSDQDLVELSELVESAKNDAEAAKTAAEAAQAQAEAAKADAEAAKAEAKAAQAAAEQAAAEAGEDRTAAEAAKVKAEEAQAKAEAAQTAAEEAQGKATAAQTAAEAAQAAAQTAAEAAEQSNREAAMKAAEAAGSAKAAAENAAKAAFSAAEAAASAEAAAGSATEAAKSMVEAQKAQAAAEDAQVKAEEAKKKAEEARKKADEAAQSAAENKESAEKAAAEAKAAQEAADKAQKAAEDARAAAETARNAAEEANREAAAAAAEAAAYAKQMADTYAEIVAIKAEIVEYLAQAQKAAEDAEAAKKAAEEAQKKVEEALKKAQEAALTAAKYGAIVELVGIDVSGYTAEQMELVDAALATAREAVAAAETVEEVEDALAVAKEAILAAGKMVCASDLFRDVAENAWYHKGVDFVVRNGYMEGMGNGIFGVNSAITRGQMVTILYRMENKPSVEGLENVFTDVADGQFYTDAVIWAASEGIVEGNGDGTFNPNGAITREQLAAILYRYDGKQAVTEDALAGFSDGKSVSPFAVEAMNWAVANGLIHGIGNGSSATLSPKATASRSQFATILMRYMTEG